MCVWMNVVMAVSGQSGRFGMMSIEELQLIIPLLNMCLIYNHILDVLVMG